MKGDTEVQLAAIVQVREIRIELHEAAEHHDVATPDPTVLVGTKDALDDAEDEIDLAKIALRKANRRSDPGSQEVADRQSELSAAKTRYTMAQRAHATRLAELARLKSTHFPELDIAASVHAGLSGALRKAGLVVDNFNFELSATVIKVLAATPEARHNVYGVKLADGSEAALKEFNLAGKGRTLQTLQREAGLLHRLRHPNITELTAVLINSDGTKVHLQLPLYRGGTLEDPTVRSCSTLPNDVEQWPVDLVLMMMHQLLSAVAHLHANNVVQLRHPPQQHHAALHRGRHPRVGVEAGARRL